MGFNRNRKIHFTVSVYTKSDAFCVIRVCRNLATRCLAPAHAQYSRGPLTFVTVVWSCKVQYHISTANQKTEYNQLIFAAFCNMLRTANIQRSREDKKCCTHSTSDKLQPFYIVQTNSEVYNLVGNNSSRECDSGC